MKKSKLLLALLLSLSGLLFGCSGSNNPGFESPTISLSESKIYLSEGQTFQLVATTSKTSMLTFWFTRDSEIATVSDSGLVSAIKTGETVCYAQVGSNTAMCSIVVNPYEPDSDLLLTCNSDLFNLNVGDIFSLPLKVKFGEVNITDYNLSASVEDDTVCSYSGGKITALAVGETSVLLTASYEQSTDQLLITINVKQ